MKLLIVLCLGLGAPSLWAQSDCIEALTTDSVLNRAASLETRILRICQPPAPSQVIAACAGFTRKLAVILGGAEDKPRSAAEEIVKLQRETERLGTFLEAYAAAPASLATYLSFPQFLEPDTTYTTRGGQPVRFSKSLLTDLRRQDRLAGMALNALDHGHVIRLSQDARVVEVRIRAREFSNARMYGIFMGGVIWIDLLIRNHMRAHDIPGVVAKLKRAAPDGL